MPIARKIDKDIPKDFLNQMKTNLKKSPVVVEEEPPVQVVATSAALRQAQEPQASVVPEALEGPQSPTSTMQSTRAPSTGSGTTVTAGTPIANILPVKTDKYADVMNIRLSKGRRNEIKAFCSSNGVTVTQYIESSFEFLSREVAAGNISLSKGGITKKQI